MSFRTFLFAKIIMKTRTDKLWRFFDKIRCIMHQKRGIKNCGSFFENGAVSPPESGLHAPNQEKLWRFECHHGPFSCVRLSGNLYEMSGYALGLFS